MRANPRVILDLLKRQARRGILDEELGDQVTCTLRDAHGPMNLATLDQLLRPPFIPFSVMFLGFKGNSASKKLEE